MPSRNLSHPSCGGYLPSAFASDTVFMGKRRYDKTHGITRALECMYREGKQEFTTGQAGKAIVKPPR